jgi:hypothetical protein
MHHRRSRCFKACRATDRRVATDGGGPRPSRRSNVRLQGIFRLTWAAGDILGFRAVTRSVRNLLACSGVTFLARTTGRGIDVLRSGFLRRQATSCLKLSQQCSNSAAAEDPNSAPEGLPVSTIIVAQQIGGAVAHGNASTICCASHSAVGCRVTANHSSCRRLWATTMNAYKQSKLTVGTTHRSIAAIAPQRVFSVHSSYQVTKLALDPRSSCPPGCASAV